MLKLIALAALAFSAFAQGLPECLPHSTLQGLKTVRGVITEGTCIPQPIVSVIPIDVQRLRDFGLPGLENARDHWQIVVKPAKADTIAVKINYTLTLNGKSHQMQAVELVGQYGAVFFYFVDRIANTSVTDVKPIELTENSGKL